MCKCDGYEHCIVDAGAINHIVVDMILLNGQSISKVENQKKVFLPNGDITLVTHLDSCKINGKNTVLGVFYMP